MTAWRCSIATGRRQFFVNSYVKPRVLAHDKTRTASYRADKLITKPIAVNILPASTRSPSA